MFLTKLAIKNLTRHKKRTIITALVISFGIFIFLLSDSLMIGLRDISLDNNINLETAHLQIMEEDYWNEKEESPLDYLLKENNEVINKIGNDYSNITQYTSRLKFTATINNGQEEYPITVIGIQPQKEIDIFELEEYVLEGEMLRTGKYAMIGISLANMMGFEIGDYVTLLFKNKEGTFNTIDAELQGILDTPNPMINEMHVYVPLSLAQNSLNLENKVSKFLFRLENRDQSVEMAANLNKEFKQDNLKIKAYHWEQLSKEVLAMVRQGNVENLVMLAIIILLATVGVINTVILAALERLEEIGMMKALGLKSREIVYIFVIESAGIGIIGSTIGVIFGAIGVYLLKNIGISVSAMTGGTTSFGMPIAGRIYGGWHPEAFLFIFIFGIIISTLVSILPARWGAKKDPVKAIYHR
ncbi:MAG TPA: FtsX-like permease family protein [Halanaerobiales bacterium]|nr:FtsX-like permease family protein [Halanaerobiales bacterium]